MVDNGDGPRPSSVDEVIQGWQVTLAPLDAVYHQVNQYLIALTVGEGFDVRGGRVWVSWVWRESTCLWGRHTGRRHPTV